MHRSDEELLMVLYLEIFELKARHALLKYDFSLNCVVEL